MRPALTIATALLVFAAVARAQSPPAPSDHCEQFATCADCVANYLCGWCSTPVIYQGNITGKNCAGYNKNGKDPFQCNGVYSIEECQEGYECDLDNFQCKIAGKGNGKTLQECEANCTNEGQVYLCNHTDLKCHEVPRGTPGSASYSVCEASCAHPSAHPSPPTPHSPAPPAAVYACNGTTGKCELSQPGKGSSLQVCEEQCHKSSNQTLYYCNSIEHKCVVAPKGFPGEDKAECEKMCLPHPNPGPPPMFEGTWRGVQINNGYKVGEFDFFCDQTSVVFVDVQSATTIKGTPYNVQNGESADLWIKVTAGPGAGQTIKVIGQDDGRGPETKFLLAAFSAAGGATPDSITSAMSSSSGDTVYFFSACVGTPECHFTMPNSLLRRRGSRLLDHVRRHHQHHKRGTDSDVQHFADARAEHALGETDPCAAYAANCSYCLAHPFCGWCSSDVTYKDGKKGTQCAGFATSPNATNPFICEGRYSTLACTAGWTCNEQTFQCVQNATPGNGFPQKECEEVCRPTPSPTPQQQQYVCNITTKQCYKCEEKHCPGSMPEGACAAACVKPHKGPSTIVIGMWRGIEIQRGYPLVEIDYVFNQSSLTAYRNGELDFEASVTSFGGDEMIFDVTSGNGAGSKFSAEYTVANQGSGMVEAMTIAMSAADGPIPDSYSGPMQTKGQKELVMTKCQDSPCKFAPPSQP
uniref:PSI domain-containing protein n=1 Tax=Neobodo designis TaxID=312471 RepID=A0A7S1M8Y3_NEODS|eukprot:CAMPEP_0174852418 /NCGR_PEP_ID=MMETSP1114-20130205/25352_1 /TAXON_ID=312471 /ORGANISM="Neobodo designis, Strain CCAP 1951/1" /LENGTH=694 /DNA_ID=CAMNT_0016087009 /DNA_START=31 /DNA_END=2115 /DNA_ORIENTATION=+